ncbi:hypothetical protein FKM82_013463 [Ascaphus truei]
MGGIEKAWIWRVIEIQRRKVKSPLLVARFPTMAEWCPYPNVIIKRRLFQQSRSNPPSPTSLFFSSNGCFFLELNCGEGALRKRRLH